jgi:hypothetical protein
MVREVDELNFDNMQKDKDLIDSSLIGAGPYKTGETNHFESILISPKKEKNSSSTQVNNPSLKEREQPT